MNTDVYPKYQTPDGNWTTDPAYSRRLWLRRWALEARALTALQLQNAVAAIRLNRKRYQAWADEAVKTGSDELRRDMARVLADPVTELETAFLAELSARQDELALARMDDDGCGCAITAEANCEYVRVTLADREPALAAALAVAITTL
jgi:hypothetical protein